jgi:hypothetical protein
VILEFRVENEPPWMMGFLNLPGPSSLAMGDYSAMGKSFWSFVRDYNKVALSKLARFVCKLKEVQVP